MSLVDVVVGGSKIEDDRVECKSRWAADTRKAARQIAGLANASRGEPILWIIGLDEDGHRVVDPGEGDPASWWPSVESCFDEVAPDISVVVVVTEHGTVTALSWETSRAPFVVKTDGRTEVHREVPWRAGTGLRSARRSELLRSVVAEAAVPQLEVVSAWVRALDSWSSPSEKFSNNREWIFDQAVILEWEVTAYLEARDPVTLPEHRWHATAAAADGPALELGEFGVQGPRENDPTPREQGIIGLGRSYTRPAGAIRYVQSSGLHVAGSDQVVLSGNSVVQDADGSVAAGFRTARKVTLQARLPIAGSDRSASLTAVLQRSVKVEPEKAFPDWDEVDDRLGEFRLRYTAAPYYRRRLVRRDTPQV